MKSRQFEDEKGRVWVVTKVGLALTVKGPKSDEEKLCDIARSCARRLGVSQTVKGIPLEYVNEHRRIWNCIWSRGESANI